MDARDLVNGARARGELTQQEADLLWAQSLSAPLMARVLLLHSRGHSLRHALQSTAGDATGGRPSLAANAARA